MIPPDLAVHVGVATPEPMGAVVVWFTFGVTTFALRRPNPPLQLSISLLAGLTATVVAWLALLFVVAHGRYVTESVALGKYRKGPFHDRNPRAGSKRVDLDEREKRDGDEDE